MLQGLCILLFLGSSVFGELTLHREGLAHSHYVEDTGTELISHIIPSDGDPMVKYEQLMNNIANLGQSSSMLSCSKGEKADFMKFVSQTVGRFGLKDDVNEITLKHLEDDCFDSVKATYQRSDYQVKVTLTPNGKGKCFESYLLATTLNYHVAWLESSGKPHTVTFENLKEQELQNFDKFGLHIFRTCDSVQKLLPDVLLTLEMFLGGIGTHPHLGPIFGSKPAPWMVKSSIDFIERTTGFRWKERKNVEVELDETEVKSGDFLAITRFDGIDQLIQYGAGSHSGHSALLLEVDGEMNVIESQDGWYWPKHGIQRTTWSQWKKWAKNAGFNVAVLPLSAESRANFDVKKAADYFKSLEGYPYGYHNFVFGWVDTSDGNFPPILDKNFAIVVFSLLEKIVPATITQFLGEGFNMRMGTKGLTIDQMAVELTNRGQTFDDLWAMVEKDEWIYSDGPSRVCSAFAADIYRAGGILHDIESAEFTPKDVYTLTIFDKAPERPQKCKDADPDLPYCQVFGTHSMELPNYSTIKPYPHMCERCPTMPPEFFRPDGC